MYNQLNKLNRLLKVHKVKGINPLDGKMWIQISGDVVHSNLCLSALPTRNFDQLTIRDILKFPRAHECVGYGALVSFEDTQIALGHLVNTLDHVFTAPLPKWEEVSVIDDAAAAVGFAYAMATVFIPALSELDEHGVIITNWLHHNADYPATATEILAHYDQQVRKLSGSILAISSPDYSDQDQVLALEDDAHREKIAVRSAKLTADYQADLAGRKRAVAVASRIPAVEKLAFLDLQSSLLRVIIDDLNPGNADVVSFPPRLAAALTFRKVIAPSHERVNWIPTPQDLLTVETLHHQGMSLKDALVAAKELR